MRDEGAAFAGAPRRQTRTGGGCGWAGGATTRRSGPAGSSAPAGFRVAGRRESRGPGRGGLETWRGFGSGGIRSRPSAAESLRRSSATDLPLRLRIGSHGLIHGIVGKDMELDFLDRQFEPCLTAGPAPVAFARRRPCGVAWAWETVPEQS